MGLTKFIVIFKNKFHEEDHSIQMAETPSHAVDKVAQERDVVMDAVVYNAQKCCYPAQYET